MKKNKPPVHETGSIQMNQSLIDTTNFFEVFTDSSSDLCLIYDKDLRIVYLNNKALEYSGVESKEALIGVSVEDLVPTIVETGVKEDYLKVLETGVPLFRESVESVPSGKVHFALRAFRVSDYLAVVASDITDLKAKEVADRRNLRKVEQYIEETLDPCVILDGTGNIVFVNPAFCRILKISSNKLKNLKLTRFVHATEQENMDSILQTWIESGETIGQLENRLTDTDGKVHHIAWNINLVRTPANEIEQLTLIGKDLTELRKAEEKAILQAEIIEQVHDAVITTDLNGNIIEWNREATRKFGFNRDEIIGKELTILIAHNAADIDLNRLEKTLSNNGEVESKLNFLRKDGSEFPGEIRFSPLIDKNEERKGYIGVVSDLTQINQMLENLRTNEKRLINAQRLATLGYFEWNIQNDSLWISDELYDIYKVSRTNHSMKPNKLFRMAHPDDQSIIEKMILEAVKKCKGFDHEYRINDADGAEKIVHEQVEIISGEEGQALLMTGAIQDITQRKKAEEKILSYKNQLEEMISERTHQIESLSRELIESSRKSGMAEVATGVLHNVGNVLNSINISVSMLSTNVDRLESQKIKRVCELLEENKAELGNFFSESEKGIQLVDYLQLLSKDQENVYQTLKTELNSVEKHVDHIKHIVRMQQFHATSEGIKEERRLSQLLEEATVITGLNSDDTNIELKRDYDTEDKIVIETHKLLQILVNLLSNAKDSVLNNGNSEKKIIISFKSTENDCNVTIEDNGVGLESIDPDRIFSMGYSTKPDGHGYGLHTSANLATEIGGSIRAHSEGKNKGACFTLRFNRCQQ